MFVKEIKRKVGSKKYCSVLIQESYRVGKHVKSRTIANISKLPKGCIDNIKAFFGKKDGKKAEVNLDQIEILNSKEYGGSHTLLTLVRKLGLDQMIYSRKVQWREDVLAMIVGRLLYPGSKLSLTNMFADTVLWELCGHPSSTKPDVNKNCYHPLDQLLERQEAIQEKLAKKHLKNGCIVLYDITSSYFEGEYEESDLVTYGYSRDCKKGHEQVNIGLLTNADGCPVAVETFPGNMTDQVTVQSQVKKITDRFCVKDVIFVGDRGMLTPKRIIEVNDQGFKTITALTHSQMQGLLDRGVISSTQLFDQSYPEYEDSLTPGLRYVLCHNPERRKSETATRLALIEKVISLLDKLSQSKRKRQEKDLGAAVGKIFARYKIEKFFSWSIENQKLKYSLKQSVIDKEALLDGCYVIRTDVSKNEMSSSEVVKAYKKLSHVEQAFRVIKTTALEIRPMYHHLDDRICAHVFLCMLAYYLQWHAKKRLESIFEEDGKGKNRRWTFLQVMERLKSIRSQSLKLGDVTVDKVVSKPDEEQELLLKALKQ